MLHVHELSLGMTVSVGMLASFLRKSWLDFLGYHAPPFKSLTLSTRCVITDHDADVQSSRQYKREYLLTWSHTNLDDGRKKSSDMSMELFGRLALTSANRVFGRTNCMRKVAVFDERHSSGEIHKHAAIYACEKKNLGGFIPEERTWLEYVRQWLQ